MNNIKEVMRFLTGRPEDATTTRFRFWGRNRWQPFRVNQIVLSENSCEQRRRQNPSLAWGWKRNWGYLVNACVLHKPLHQRQWPSRPILSCAPLTAIQILGCPRGCEDAK